ncbi:MAG: serine hydrolase [Bacillota bacterium]
MRGILAIPATLLLLLPAAVLYLNTALAQGEAVPAPPAPVEPPAVHVAVPEQPATPTAPPQDQMGTPQESGTQVASADRPPAWDKAPLLAEAVERAMSDFTGDFSVIVQQLESDLSWTYQPDQRYHPASTIKMPVTLYALEQYRAGKASWQDLIQYTAADFESPGGGAFETAPFGGLYPIENLVGRALKYSNNVAVNMLGRHFGWDQIRKWTTTIGGDLYREPDGSPRVTARSELGWWLHLYKLSQEDPQSAELLLQPLREVAYNGRITAGLPKGISHLHKFGSYNGSYHDGGIIYAETPYVLIVLTHGATEDQADAAIARLSAEVYKVMTSDKA